MRVFKHHHRLPREVVRSQSLDTLKNHLEKDLINQV